MATGKRWRRDELLVMLNIYEKIPFGQFDEAQPLIKDIAKHMHRTPGSVAMKLCNLASLDPAVKARGRKGLSGASDLDREVWAEFQQHHDEMVPLTEEAFRALVGAATHDEVDLVKGVGVRIRKVLAAPTGPTDVPALVAARRGQQFFRQMVLNAFDGRCGITRIAVRELLVASHILPWKSHPDERLNQRNGICLSRLHDGAFDRGLITFDDQLRLVLSKELKQHLPQPVLESSFVDFVGKPLEIPAKALSPSPEFLAFHRERIFRG